MSETPTPYDVPPMNERVETLERQQIQNTDAIIALVDALDRLRSTIETRLTGMQEQMAAVNSSNQLLAELLTARLPPPTNEI